MSEMIGWRNVGTVQLNTDIPVRRPRYNTDPVLPIAVLLVLIDGSTLRSIGQHHRVCSALGGSIFSSSTQLDNVVYMPCLLLTPIETYELQTTLSMGKMRFFDFPCEGKGARIEYFNFAVLQIAMKVKPKMSIFIRSLSESPQSSAVMWKKLNNVLSLRFLFDDCLLLARDL